SRDAGGPRDARDRRSPRDARDRRDPRGEPRPPSGEPAPAATAPDAELERYMLSSATFDGPTVRLDPKRPVAPTDDLELEGPTGPAIPWGKDDDGPAPEVVLAPDLPDDAPLDDPDPVSYPLLEAASAP